MSDRVLILGANGRFGRHAALAFAQAGWDVATYTRGSSMVAAAEGADVIVNGLNPAYSAWAKELPGITARVIEAAKSSGATVLLPGNVYNFGDNPQMPWGEHTAHAPHTSKGRLRVEMEAQYRTSGVQTIVLRAGDFVDTEVSGNWYESHMATKLCKGKLTYPGSLNEVHSWAYLPDLARAAVKLAAKRAELDRFEDVPFPGYQLTGAELAGLLEAQLKRKIRVKSFPWWAIRLAAPLWPMGRELLEMRYLWELPHRLDGAKFCQLLPGFHTTAPETAFTSVLKQDVQPDEAVVRA